MSEEHNLQDLKATEAALAALAPAPAALDRDRLMFQAGQAARPRFSWSWPAATGLLAAVAAALALVIVLRPPVVTETVIVRVPVEAAPAPSPKTSTEPSTLPEIAALGPAADDARSPAPPGYLRLQEQILHWGLDVLPSGPLAAPAEAPLTLQKLLGEAPKSSQPSSWWKLDKLIPIGGQS